MKSPSCSVTTGIGTVRLDLVGLDLKKDGLPGQTGKRGRKSSRKTCRMTWQRGRTQDLVSDIQRLHRWMWGRRARGLNVDSWKAIFLKILRWPRSLSHAAG